MSNLMFTNAIVRTPGRSIVDFLLASMMSGNTSTNV